jgi:hypothetical protein
MDDIAKELVKIAKELVGKSSKEFARKLIDDIKSIKVLFGEAGFGKLKGKKFKSAKDTEKAFEKIDREDVGGYDKVDVLIETKDGGQIKGYTYYHSNNDAPFVDQLEKYIMARLTEEK